MKPLKAIGLAALLSVGIGCAGNKVYEVPSQSICIEAGKNAEECCVKIDGCGKLCYEGFTSDGNGFSIRMNGETFMYSTLEKNLYPCGCPLERGAVTDGLLVVLQRIKPLDFP